MNVTDVLSHPESAINASSQERYAQTKDQFLKLLMAQLKNQDPMDSPDINKISEQITQFGQLEQLMNLNTSVESMSKFQSSQERSQAVALVGKNVQVADDSINVNGLDKGKIHFRLSDDADEVNVTIRDSLGRTIRTVTYKNVASGDASFDFDGLTDDGQNALDGNYRLEVSARKQNGIKVGASTLSEGPVDDVSFTDKGTILSVNGRSYSIDQVLSVRQGPVAI